jgi:hypothetical protein
MPLIETRQARKASGEARPLRGLAALGAPLVLLTAGCFPYTIDMPGTPPVDPSAAVRADAAEVCVIRTSVAGGTQVLRDNGQLAGATLGKGYFCYGARPGAHRLTSEAGSTAVTVDVVLAAGERVFLRQSFGEEAELVRVREPEARAALGRLPFEQLVGAPEPVLSPQALAGAAADLPAPPPPGPPPPASPPRRRPSGLAYGLAAGLGLGASRAPPATETTSGFAALASIWAGVPATDSLLLAVRIDLSLAGGAGRSDVLLHLAWFPGAARSGKVADFMIFADGGVRLPTAVGSGPGDPRVGGAGRLGIGWEPWSLGPVVVGPFLSGEMSRGGGESDAALIGGLGASLYPKAAPR